MEIDTPTYGLLMSYDANKYIYLQVKRLQVTVGCCKHYLLFYLLNSFVLKLYDQT